MAFSTIDKSTSFQNTVLYTGNGSSQSITGVGFQPDLTWIKSRSYVDDHVLTDTVRGATKTIFSNAINAEETQVQGLTAFGADGFSVGSMAEVNTNAGTIVGWNWKAGTTSGIATNGSTTITPSAYSFNQTSGFSICKYTGNYTSGAKVAHGLGATPKMFIVKRLSETDDWTVYHQYMDATAPEDYGQFWNNNDVKTNNSAYWNDTAPDSVNFTIGNNGRVNTSGATYIAYCFADVAGYSDFGSYIGNNNDDGPFIYTGFKPNFVLTKSTTTAEGWNIADKDRIYNVATPQIRNPKGYFLYPAANSAESTAVTHSAMDLLSNGFKLRRAHGQYNGTATHIYMAFGQPIISNSGVCATAR